MMGMERNVDFKTLFFQGNLFSVASHITSNWFKVKITDHVELWH